VLKQTSLFTTKLVDRTAIEAYLFFTLELTNELSGDHYSRTKLAQITREVNLLFAMPVMILFKHGNSLTLSVINRRLHKRDESRDVLEKVTLIKDIQIHNPHRAHIEILFDLSFEELKNKFNFTNFVELHNAWQKSLDTKELNKRFYRELANWYFWAVQNVEFPADTETERDVRNATNVIRLITRLIFVWFLKEKGLMPDELFNQNRLRQILKYIDVSNSTYYKAILQNLFFATLNTEMGKRQFRNRAKKTGDRDQHYMIHNVFRYEDYFSDPEDTLTKYFTNIPFLNGGLFECLDIRDENTGKQARTDGFSDRKDNVLRVPDELFFSEEQEIDLNNVYGTKNKTYRARGIINLLNNYKFTIAENTPVEEEVALDPELLGKVFENLLASYNPETGSTARKQTGSFYTPREIVNYMVDESLIAYLQTKLASSSDTIPSPLTGEGQGGGEKRLRHLFSYTDEPHQFNPKEVDILIDAIDGAKILDPACGSGAFPMGILHKLVYILSKLDPNNQKWRQRQINKVMEVPDVIVREKLIEDIEQAFQSNELDYGRKLYLIENAIFGVDIQPIAVQIAKLRFFISLIVDQKISHTSPPLAGGAGGGENLGIRPLPNLETKFVAANTLIGIERPQQLMLRNPDIDKKEAELKKVRERHFTARTPQTKEKYRKEDERLRGEISQLLSKDGFTRDVTEKLAKWSPYDQNSSADFFDPEWMFGVKGGFDIVIGNPPYLSALGLKKLITENEYSYLKRNFETAKGAVDFYIYFFERGLKLLRVDGTLSYISPNRYLSASYGEALREFIFNNATLISIIDYSDVRVFEEASTYPILSFLRKGKRNDYQILIGKYNEETNALNFKITTSHKLNFTEEYIWGFLLNDKIQITEKIISQSVPLTEACKINATSTTSEADDYHLLINERSGYKLINTGTIDRYCTTWGKKFMTDKGKRFLKPYLPINSKKISDNRYRLYSSPKIIFAKIALRAEAFYDNKHEYASINTNCLHSFSPDYDPKYILSWVNSNLFQFTFECFFEGLKMQGGYLLYSSPNLSCMFIKKVDFKTQKPFISIVDNIIIQKLVDEDTTFLERLIDAMVYELYMEEEVKAAGCEVLKHLTNLPELKEDWSDEKKLQTIDTVYKELSNPKHPVSVAMFKMDTIEEIRIIKGKQ